MTELELPPFEDFKSIARLHRDCVVTEKLDGTNAQVFIAEDFTTMHIGSRNRWVKVGDDNFGFAAWAQQHREELLLLGPGRHYGEWWGQGIQRKYGLTEKRFSLFNTHRWNAENTPPCVHVVPVLYSGPFDTAAIDNVLESLYINGSVAAPGFMNPEGIVVYHTHAGVYFKKTLDKNDKHKWEI